jgi:hypothetical protein
MVSAPWLFRLWWLVQPMVDEWVYNEAYDEFVMVRYLNE